MVTEYPLVVLNMFSFLWINVPLIHLYSMFGLSSVYISEALWKFFVDAGGFPKTLQCDFDNRLIGGKAAAFLRSHETRI